MPFDERSPSALSPASRGLLWLRFLFPPRVPSLSAFSVCVSTACATVASSPTDAAVSPATITSPRSAVDFRLILTFADSGIPSEPTALTAPTAVPFVRWVPVSSIIVVSCFNSISPVPCRYQRIPQHMFDGDRGTNRSVPNSCRISTSFPIPWDMESRHSLAGAFCSLWRIYR